MKKKWKSLAASLLAAALLAASCLFPAAAEPVFYTKVSFPAGFQAMTGFYDGSAFVSKGDEIGLIDSDGNYKKLGNYSFTTTLSAGMSFLPMPYLILLDGSLSESSELGINILTKDGTLYTLPTDMGVGAGSAYAAASSIPVPVPGIFELLQTLDLPCMKDGKYGLIDPHGKPLIPFEYDAIGDTVSEDLIAVAKADAGGVLEWGYADRSGEVVIPLSYADAGPFSEGFAAVMAGDKYGYIDKTGELKIPAQYDEAGGFSNGCAYVAENGLYNIIDTSGAALLDEPYQSIEPLSDYSGLLYDIPSTDYLRLHDGAKNLDGIFSAGEKKIIAEPAYTSIVSYNGNHTFTVSRFENEAYTCGVLDSSGTEIFPCEYVWIDYLGEDLYALYTDFEENSTGTVAGIDGTVKSFPAFSDLGKFTDGLAYFEQDGSYGYVNPEGEVAVPAVYGGAYDFSGGAAIVAQNEKQGLIDTAGNVLIPFEHDSLTQMFDGTVLGLTDASSNPDDGIYITMESFDATGTPLAPDSLATSISLGDGMILASPDAVKLDDMTLQIIMTNQVLYRGAYGESAEAINAVNQAITDLPTLPAPFTEEQKDAAKAAIDAAAAAYSELNYAEQQVVRGPEKLERAAQRIALETPLWGDVTNDTELSALDIMQLRKYMLSGTGLDLTQQVLADLSGDYQITAVDIMRMRKLMLESPSTGA